MAATVGAKHTEGQPAAIKLSRAPVCEAPDEVTLEGEATQSQRQAAPERAGHTAIGILWVSAEVQRVTLTAGPGAPRPHDALPCYLFSDLGYRLVVAQ